ncbi:MAG: N-acetylglucosamine-6-phosphate deacetylase, partial [Limisphaerales bacterium]
RWMLTHTTVAWPVMLSRLKHLRSVRANSEILRKRIAGWHVEGPFLSAVPGFKGAHDGSVMTDPTCERIDELKAVLGDDPILLTLAAERAGSIEVIRHAVSCGITVSIGHSDASAENLRDAVEAGATAFTHLGNGMPQEMDRHDNIVSRVIDTDRLVCGLIADGIHLAPQMFRLLHKALPADLIYYTTDAISAAGAPPGRYHVGRDEVEVGEDKVVRIPGQSNFAGSALSPCAAIHRAADMLGRSWRDVWDFYSINAAKLVGLTAGLEPGCPADLCEVVGDEQTAKTIKHVVG